MKVRWTAVLVAVCLLSSCWARVAAEEYNPDMVRLHVLANSDSSEDQAEKMRVVLTVRDEAAKLTQDCANADEAYGKLQDGVSLMEAAVREAGYEGNVRVETGVYEFPEKEYAGVIVPAGKYRAVRVLLGKGEGHNWWCVLYPDMCVVDEACAEAIRQGEPITFYSGIARWIKRLLGGEAEK